MGKFSFGGKTIVAPGILVAETIGAQRVLQLLPFGTLAFVGPSDGGVSNGIYSFGDTNSAKRTLRSGPLLDAITRAANIGGSTGLIAVVVGAKTPATLALTGAAASAATLTSGDQGLASNSIAVSIIEGTADGSVAVTFSYVDPLTGATSYIGGIGTPLDNITTFSQIKAAVEANGLLTPAVSTGLLPLVTVTVTTDGLPTVLAKTNLAGGTGGGNQVLTFSDWKAAIDGMIDVNFDMAHLVGCYDPVTQAYADGQAFLVYAYGRMRRWVHQVKATGVSATQTKVQNSEAVANALIGAGTALNSIRSSVIAQQVRFLNPATGTYDWVDAAPLYIGLAALLGATGPNGPASPLTKETLPGATAVDYGVLKTTGDIDNAILGGGIVLEQRGTGGGSSVRIVQSVTTAPNDSEGNPWVFAEFSVVRVSDALLANVVAAVEAGKPKIIGGGNTVFIMTAALAEARDVLELALQNTWITSFDPASLTIYTTGTLGEDDIMQYSAAPTLPLNHLGIEQTLLPFQATVNLGTAAA